MIIKLSTIVITYHAKTSTHLHCQLLKAFWSLNENNFLKLKILRSQNIPINVDIDSHWYHLLWIPQVTIYNLIYCIFRSQTIFMRAYTGHGVSINHVHMEWMERGLHYYFKKFFWNTFFFQDFFKFQDFLVYEREGSSIFNLREWN